MQHKDKKQKTRDRILSSAAEIFSEVGFAGARVDEIAARAQVNKAAIYYHIGDKEALYHAVLRYIVRITADRICPVENKHKEPIRGQGQIICDRSGFQEQP